MKKFIRNAFTVGLLHATVLLSAQTNWPWAVKSSGSAYESVGDVATDGLNNSYIVGTYQNGTATFGSTTLASLGNSDVFLEKLDGSGVVQWAVRAGSNLDDNGIDVAVNTAGTDIFITGTFRGTMTLYSTNGTTSTITGSSSNENCFIARYNASGVIQWAASYGSTDHDRPREIAISHSSQRIYVTGYSTPPTSSNNKLFVTCYDYTGTFKWDILSSNVNAAAPWSAITADASGNSYALLNYESTGVTLPSGTYSGTNGVLLTKININGTISWVQNIGSGSGGAETGRFIGLDLSNNIYVGGHYEGTASLLTGSLSNAGSGSKDLFAMKCDNAGNYQWATRIGGGWTELLQGFTTTPGGTTYLLASNTGFPTNTVNIGCQTYVTDANATAPDHKIFVAKLSKEGIINGSAAPQVSSVGTIPTGISTDALGYPVIVGGMVGTMVFGSTSLSTVSSEDAFAAKLVIWDETPQVTSPVNTCVGQSASLSAYALSGSPTFNWYNSSNTLVGSGSSYITHVFPSPSSTIFYVSASYPGGCVTGKVPVQVSAIAYTTLLASADQTICAGNCANLTYTFSGGPGMAFIEPGYTLISSPHAVCPVATTEYTLTNGLFSQCQIGDKVKVTVVSPPLFAGDYKAYVYPSTPCSNTDDEKATCPTVGCISTTTPSSTHLPTFRCQISEQAGWQGAGNVGITGFNISGQYTVDVYEADINGNRKVIGGITAPSVFLQYGVSPAATLVLPFNSNGNGAGYTLTPTDPFTSDGTADGYGSTGTGDYFKDRYTAAYNNTIMGLAGEKLADYSNVIFCVDMKQVPFPGYCSVSKKSYFKIANNGLLNGRGARLANQEDANGALATITGWDIYPNPSSGIFHIKLESTSGADQAQIFDYTGKLISVHKLNGTDHTLDLSVYAKGIYFIRLNGNGTSEMKKVVLE